MPLKGEEKKLYQREYMRNYMRSKRGSVKTLLRPAVKTQLKGGEAPLEPKAKKLAQLRELIDNPDVTQSNSSPLKEESNTRVPRYNPGHPQVGEEVVMPSGDVVIVPELDGDGNPIEVGSLGRSSSFNGFKPSFIPDHKPEKRQKGRRH